MSASTATSAKASSTSDESVRVLHACTVGISARVFLLPLLKRLQAEGFDVSFACRDDNDARFVAGHGVHLFPVFISRGFSPRDLLAVLRLYRFIRRRRFHIVHTHTAKAGFVGRLAAWLAGVPVVLCTQHGFAIHASQPRVVRAVYTALERWIGRRTNHFITVTDRVRAYLIELGIARLDTTTRIYNGIDFTRFNPAALTREARAALRASWGCAADTVVIGTVSRLVTGKGLDDLIEAFAKASALHRHALLVVAGSGELMEPLRALARRLGVFSAVRFIGWQQDMPVVLSCFDVFALPTLREGFGYVFLEAQAMGVPVVATNIEPLTETMVDGETAVLVPTHEPAELAHALSALVADPQRRAAFAASGCARVHSLFDLRTQLDQTVQLYSRMITVLRPPRACPVGESD